MEEVEQVQVAIDRVPRLAGARRRADEVLLRRHGATAAAVGHGGKEVALLGRRLVTVHALLSEVFEGGSADHRRFGHGRRVLVVRHRQVIEHRRGAIAEGGGRT